MKINQLRYHKNYALIVIFLALITVCLFVILYLSFEITNRYVENEFTSKKIEVLESTNKSYNEFFQQKIPEVSFYQGFLDEISAQKYADSVLKNFGFVKRIVFYDLEISNQGLRNGLRVANFCLNIKSVNQFTRNNSKISTSALEKSNNINPVQNKGIDFNNMGLKLTSFVDSVDTSQNLNAEAIFKTFYNISSSKISYLTVPRREDVRAYKDVMYSGKSQLPVYQQDMMTFDLDPYKLIIQNNHKEIYEHIRIEPLSYDPLMQEPDLVYTEIPLSGAFAEYKLFITSSQEFINAEIKHRFFPFAIGIFLIYIILSTIAVLIYRNLLINQKLFKLQYDFVNNFTHEFKTPVSVIKLVGNSLGRTKVLNDNDKARFGKILDDEADKLNDLMNRLLSFTQIENGSIVLKKEQILLHSFLEELINPFLLKYPKFEIKYDIEEVKTFTTDPVLLGSIFNNMIENAYKYSFPDKKFLEIEIKRFKKFIVLKFKDKGIGIPKRELNNIFKKFYRIPNQFNQQGSVGLGLAFCKELVTFMNGNIVVKSRENLGSEFKIYLPYEQ